jgi:hypothetical protein
MLNLISDSGDSGNKKCKRALVAPEVASGGVSVWREYEEWNETVGFLFLRSAKTGFRSHEKVLTLNLRPKEIL